MINGISLRKRHPVWPLSEEICIAGIDVVMDLASIAQRSTFAIKKGGKFSQETGVVANLLHQGFLISFRRG